MKTIYLILIILLCSGCTNYTPKVQEFFQTDNATLVQEDYTSIIKLLAKYKKKLDLRNPASYDKQFSHYMYKEFRDSTNSLYMKKDEKYITDYKSYIKIAFAKETKLRNDYLLLGLYKQIWLAYEQNEIHQITTLTYNDESLKTLFYMLEVIKWKINTKKDDNGNYLFLTWQNNWQVELKKHLDSGEEPSWEMIQNLKYIKNGKESLYSPSNPNFEILMNEMIYRVENSLKILGEEPLDISIEAMKNLVFFL